MLQLNDTARSLRALADQLNRHPEALIRGRAGSRTRMLPAHRRSLAAASWRSPGAGRPIPVLYSLAVPPGPTLPGGPKVVALREVSLAGYLDRLQIVRSSEDYRLTVSENEWWGEPLGGMLTRVLAAALAQRLPRSSVVGADTAIR